MLFKKKQERENIYMHTITQVKKYALNFVCLDDKVKDSETSHPHTQMYAKTFATSQRRKVKLKIKKLKTEPFYPFQGLRINLSFSPCCHPLL